MLLHVVADFGRGDLAFAEVAQRIKNLLPEADLVLTAVPPFATLAAGFAVAQLALNEGPNDAVVFHNVAPRRDDEAPRSDNAGERLAAMRLPNGVTVVGVHAGYAFSFLAESGAELRYARADAAGSQFRSRDIFPAALARIVRGERGALEGVVPAASVPPVPEARVAYVDAFGNVKTTVRSPGPLAEAPEGSRVRVRVGTREHSAVLVRGSFSVPAGALALAQGSSGWRANGHEVRWLELFLRGGSAAELFGHPSIGQGVEVGGPVPT